MKGTKSNRERQKQHTACSAATQSQRPHHIKSGIVICSNQTKSYTTVLKQQYKQANGGFLLINSSAHLLPLCASRFAVVDYLQSDLSQRQ